jgi:formiminotetrahydrofolate cyclodeaminase
MKYDIDLRQHILFVSFRNKFIEPSSPESTQELIARLMVDYPHIFQTSVKISYTIAALKTEGLIYEQQQLDTEAYNKCLDSMKQQHPRMSEARIRKECLRKIGYKSILMPTELGVIEYCSKVMPYVKERTTKTNVIIIDVCKTYKGE